MAVAAVARAQPLSQCACICHVSVEEIFAKYLVVRENSLLDWVVSSVKLLQPRGILQ